MSANEQDRRNKKIPFEDEALIIKGEIEDLKTKQAQQEEREEKYKKSQLRFNRLLTWFTGGLLVTSVAADWISIYMARVAKESADAAKASAQAASDQVAASKELQRAFVTFDGLRIQNFGKSNNKVTVVMIAVTWRNTGGSVARSGLTHVRWVARQDGLPPGYQFPESSAEGKRVSESVIGASREVTVNLVVPLSSLIAVKEKQSRIFYWGWITYYDIFRDSPMRLTEFCEELKVVTPVNSKLPIDDPQNGVNVEWSGCGQHNCTVTDCADYKERLEFSIDLRKKLKSSTGLSP